MVMANVLFVFVAVLAFVPSAWANAEQAPTAHQCIASIDNTRLEESAWRLFACLNSKARPRVEGPTVLWETWPSPEDLICKAGNKLTCDPDNPPVFYGAAAPGPCDHTPAPVHRAARSRPNAFDGKQETYLNETVFDYTVCNKLWYLQGQQAAFLNKEHINFPLGAIEVKARWLQIDRFQRKRHLWRKDLRGNHYGLVALNIAAKSQAQWFWATFEHVDNPKRCHVIPCLNVNEDVVEIPLRTEILGWLRQSGLNLRRQPWWLNYRLHGAQGEFVDSSGIPTKLGNSILERSFGQNSSCITCHARATRDFQGNSLNLKGTDGLAFIDKPKREWFCDKEDKRTFLVLDYVWSLSLAEAVPGVQGPDLGEIPSCGIFNWLPQ
jgi:hypothetical protein